jgi:SAM-dependent methyltransferase
MAWQRTGSTSRSSTIRLEHVPDPEKALAEVHRVLKPGGVAIITTPFLVPLHGTDVYGDYTRWTPQGLAALLKRRSFEPDVRWWGNLAAAREFLGRMHMRADEAIAGDLGIALDQGEERFPVTVWALATARKEQRASRGSSARASQSNDPSEVLASRPR